MRQRDTKIVRATKARDGNVCRRCYRGPSHGLIVHHIHALADGGADDLGNTITLCEACHREWHTGAEGLLDHSTFMETPPYRFLLGVMTWDKDDQLRRLLLDKWEEVRLFLASIPGGCEWDK